MLETLAAPAVLPVSLAAAKQWLRETSTDWDAEITDMLRSAVDHAEMISKNAIVYRPVREQLDYFTPLLELRGYPARGVKSITYLDTAGASQTLDPTTYVVDVAKPQARVTPQYGRFFPPTRLVVNAVQVTYDVGLMVPITAVDSVGNVITAPGHDKAAGDIVQLSTDGDAASVLPANVVALKAYYVINPVGDTLQLSATSGGGVFALGANFAGTGCFLGVLPHAFRQALRAILNTWQKYPADVTSTVPAVLPAHAVDSLLRSYMPRGF